MFTKPNPGRFLKYAQQVVFERSRDYGKSVEIAASLIWAFENRNRKNFYITSEECERKMFMYMIMMKLARYLGQWNDPNPDHLIDLVGYAALLAARDADWDALWKEKYGGKDTPDFTKLWAQESEKEENIGERVSQWGVSTDE